MMIDTMMIDTMMIDTTSSIFKSDHSNWSVYPNPSNGRFQITSLAKIDLETIHYIDLHGNRIQLDWQKTANGKEIEFFIHHVNSGMYFVELKSAFRSEIHRIVVLK